MLRLRTCVFLRFLLFPSCIISLSCRFLFFPYPSDDLPLRLFDWDPRCCHFISVCLFSFPLIGVGPPTFLGFSLLVYLRFLSLHLFSLFRGRLLPCQLAPFFVDPRVAATEAVSFLKVKLRGPKIRSPPRISLIFVTVQGLPRFHTVASSFQKALGVLAALMNRNSFSPLFFSYLPFLSTNAAFPKSSLFFLG